MLILASASPRRHELLLAAGIDHVVRPSHVPEDRLPNETPAAFVQRIAEVKARSSVFGPEDAVLAADTVVVAANGEVLGKPVGRQDAIRMLNLLSGREHQVYTGICILSRSKKVTDLATTTVQFMQLEPQELEEYAATTEPYDKAGAYAVQGLASKFVVAIQGCYHNVVGLPISLVYRHLKILELFPKVSGLHCR